MDITNPIFQDADKARDHLESVRWPEGPVCPHCGGTERIGKMEGKSTRPGVYKCYHCRKPFSVTVGTVFERSRVPLNKWLLATHLMAASKKGYSAHQLHRTIGVSYKTAWFMMHRIREAMREDSGPLGDGGGTVEVDETYWGHSKRRQKDRSQKRAGMHHKEKIVSLVQRGGRVRSNHVPAVNRKTLKPILEERMASDANLVTDQANVYKELGKGYASHEAVNHGIGEYVRGVVHTNTIESYFSILKRGLVGTFHHVGPQHLKRYLCEFDFRYNHRSSLGIEDTERAEILLRGIAGKRLTYRRPRPTQGAGIA